jgi:uncharacterized membrane protein
MIEPGVAGRRVRAVLPLAALLLAVPFWMLVALPYFTLDAATFGRFPETFWPRRYEVLLHVTGGTLALLAGPVQLWLGLSQRSLAWHRRLGRLYVIGVALGAGSAYYLAVSSPVGFGLAYSAGLFCLALAWTSTTAMAFVAVRRRAIPQHREWMTRSYVVTFAFVLFRLMIPAFALLGVHEPREQYAAAAWLCWAVPLLVVEPMLQWRKVRAGEI